MFKNLCVVLRDNGGLVVTKNVTLKEIVAFILLHILAHDQKNSTITTTFVRSEETISRQFHNVLRTVLKIGNLYIEQEISELSQESEESWRWFPNVVGALDGTLVKLTFPAEDRSRYRNRKGDISSNVLGVCDANMKFLYVLPGWEGSASDTRVLRDALQRPNGLKVYTDHYYLVDVGYTNVPGFLAPYRATRYHLKEWEGNTPTNYKELYNLRHSSARNVIERTFGLLKT
ncbi:putative nuclease harbi1 [Phtheirospermum japonicum]|uniref:Putative nuclease harbi1 n=1 Tax=Phtheirospermum japonicum TaxID=374723 RepID=A0A830BAQ4_9LAMI|nr:putative nuclease harbi1 [Phtheirospermum japonicum]